MYIGWVDMGYICGQIKVEWDDNKNRLNKKKHGLSFELASRIFDDDMRLEEYDEEHSVNGEERYISIGLVNKVLTVVHTDRQDAIRIISARFANKEEKERYYGQYNY